MVAEMPLPLAFLRRQATTDKDAAVVGAKRSSDQAAALQKEVDRLKRAVDTQARQFEVERQEALVATRDAAQRGTESAEEAAKAKAAATAAEAKLVRPRLWWRTGAFAFTCAVCLGTSLVTN